MKIGPHDALVVVDVQYDFIDGSLAVPGAGEIPMIVNQVTPLFQTVVMTQDWHVANHLSFASQHGKKPLESILMPYGQQTLWPDHCVAGDRGADLSNDLDIDLAHLIIRKGTNRHIDSYSAFLENDRKTHTGLAGYLRCRGIKRVFFCGLAFDFCVGWSALDARALGFDAVVIEDACRAIDINGSTDSMRRELRGNLVDLIVIPEIAA